VTDLAKHSRSKIGGEMRRPALLWIDLTQCERTFDSSSVNGLHGLVLRVSGAQGLGEIMHSVQPRALCFEFDYPDSLRLTMLSETKRSYPSIPILMIAEPHSEALVIWALRARVWDYFVKPICEAEVLRSVIPLLRKDNYTGCNRRAPRNLITPGHDRTNKPPALSLSRSERAVLIERRAKEHLAVAA
jgi:DNA-binding NtrC family response regulator